jgi:hypothetical protein
MGVQREGKKSGWLAFREFGLGRTQGGFPFGKNGF